MESRLRAEFESKFHQLSNDITSKNENLFESLVILMTKKEKEIKLKVENVFQDVENLKIENKDNALDIAQLMTVLNQDESIMTDELATAKSEEVT